VIGQANPVVQGGNRSQTVEEVSCRHPVSAGCSPWSVTFQFASEWHINWDSDLWSVKVKVLLTLANTPLLQKHRASGMNLVPREHAKTLHRCRFMSFGTWGDVFGDRVNQQVWPAGRVRK